MLVLAVATALIIAVASPRYNAMQKQLDVLNTDVRETVTNERVIKSFVTEEHEKKKFRKISDELSEKSVKALKMLV